MSSRTGKRLAILIFVVVAVVGSFFAFKHFRGVRAQSLLAQEKEAGLKYYTMGDYANALKHLKYFIASESKAVKAGVDVDRQKNYVDILMKFAECRLNVPTPNSKHLIEGTALLKRAAFLEPKDTQPLIRLIGLYRQIGYLTERLDTCDKLLQLEPENPIALKARVETLYALGRSKDQTMQALDAWIAVQPTNDEAREWKLTLMDSNSQEAKQAQINYMDDLVQQYPDDIGLALLRVKVLAENGQREKSTVNVNPNENNKDEPPTAESEIRKILKRQITESKHIEEAISVLDRLGMNKEADAFLARRMQDEKNGKNSTNQKADGELARIAITRAWKQGKGKLAKQYALTPQDHLDQADEELIGWSAYFTQSADEQAVDSAFYDELAKRHTDKSRAWRHILAGRDAMLRLDGATARNELRQASRIGKGSPIAWFLLGQVDQTLGELDLAISWFRKAADSDPTWANAHTRLALTLADAGLLTQARIAGEKALHAKPTAEQYVLLAQVYIKLLEVGRGDSQLKNDTLSLLRQILDSNPNNPDMLAIYARALIVADESNDALPYIHRLIDEKLVPHSDVLIKLVETCNLFGIKGVDDLLTIGGSADSSNINVLLRLAFNWADLGQFDRGKVLLQDAVKSASGKVQPMQRQAALATYLDKYNVDEAKIMLSQLSDDYPKYAFIQRVVLDSRSIWYDEKIVVKAIDRLHKLTGDDAVAWKHYEAIRLLTFSNSQASASKVVEMLNRIVKSNPADIQVQALLAQAYEILDDRDAAIKTLSEAVDSNLVQVELYPRLIVLLRKAGKPGEAQRRLAEFAQRSIPPDRIGLLRTRVKLLADSEMWDDALRLQLMLTAADHAADWAVLGYLQERTGNRKSALKSYEAALASTDINDSIINITASFFARTGNYQRGLDLLRNLPPTVSPVNRQLLIAQYMEQSGYLGEAESTLRNLAAENNEPAAWEGLIRFMIRQKNYDEAKQTMKDAQAIAPGNADLKALSNLITVLLGGEINEDTFKALGLDNADPETREASKMLLDAEVYKRAHQKDFDTYLKQRKKNPEQEIDTSAVQAVHEYIDKLKAVTNKHPSVYSGWYMLTTEYLRDRMMDKAAQSAQTAARMLPGSSEAAKLATQTLVAAQQYDAALPYAKKWQANSLDDSYDADISTAFIYWQLKKFDEAFKQLQPWENRIITSAENLPDTIVLYATLLVHQGHIDEAQNIIWPFIQKGEPWISSYARMAEQMPSANDAEKWVNRVEPLSKSDMGARSIVVGEYYKIAQRTGKKSDYQRAIDLASSDVDNEKFNPSVISMVADAQQVVGRYDEAEQLYRLVLKRQPNNAIVMNNLAYLLYEQNQVSADAEQLSRRAVDLAKQYRFNNAIRASFIETLGLILIRNGELDDAVNYLSEGKSLDIDSIPVRIALIEAYLGKGDTTKTANEINDLDQLLQQTNRPLTAEQSQRLDAVHSQLKKG